MTFFQMPVEDLSAIVRASVAQVLAWLNAPAP